MLYHFCGNSGKGGVVEEWILLGKNGVAEELQEALRVEDELRGWNGEGKGRRRREKRKRIPLRNSTAPRLHLHNSPTTTFTASFTSILVPGIQ